MDREGLVESNPKQEIVDLISQELNVIKRRLTEVKDQVESMQTSVEREQNRYSSIATELRSIKENLDTVPREDIRDKYDEALDIRFRLATMRGQLEKFEANYKFMQEKQSLLGQVLSKIQGFDVLAVEETGNGAQAGSFDVVGIIRAQEEERQRLARSMHDGPAQSLTNFILQAEICQRLFDRSPDRAAEELNNLKTNASKTFQKVRDFIFDLRPMMLDDLGVAPTVRRYVESFRDKNDIEVKLEIVGEERRLENYREVMIFRGIQEVMSVARDYSSPTHLEIELNMSTNDIRISVEDDGRGFESEGIFDAQKEDESYEDARVQALAMLKGKLELVGGTLRVRSSETEGTSVFMEIPNPEQ